jgi:hypothetical protein
MTEQQDGGADAIVAEARKTKEMAEHVANGEGLPGEADDIRVLAGMIHQVAEQVERLASLMRWDTTPTEVEGLNDSPRAYSKSLLEG